MAAAKLPPNEPQFTKGRNNTMKKYVMTNDEQRLYVIPYGDSDGSYT